MIGKNIGIHSVARVIALTLGDPCAAVAEFIAITLFFFIRVGTVLITGMLRTGDLTI